MDRGAEGHHEPQVPPSILGRLPETLAAARRATQVDTIDPEAWPRRGKGFNLAGDFDRAREALARVLEISAEHADASGYMAIAIVVSGRASEAKARVERSRKVCFRLAFTALSIAAHPVAQVHAWRGEPDRAFGGLSVPSRSATRRSVG